MRNIIFDPISTSCLRDRPFNFEFFFRTTQELEYLFFCRTKCEFFFQNLTLGYMTKTLNQIIFFFLHQNQNIFYQQLWESEYLAEQSVSTNQKAR